MAHDDVVRSVAWNPSPLYMFDIIASCSEDKTVKFFQSDFDNKNFKKIKDELLDSAVWDVKWNMTGTMLAASYRVDSKENSVAVFREKKAGDWQVVDTITMN